MRVVRNVEKTHRCTDNFPGAWNYNPGTIVECECGKQWKADHLNWSRKWRRVKG